MIFISMSAALTDFVNDEPGVRDLVADPSTRFVFGCLREYVLGEDTTRAPHELVWRTDIRARGEYVDLNQVPEHLTQLWEQFRSHIASADADQRIWWGLGRGNDDEVNRFVDVYVTSYPQARELLSAAGEQIYGYTPAS